MFYQTYLKSFFGLKRSRNKQHVAYFYYRKSVDNTVSESCRNALTSYPTRFLENVLHKGSTSNSVAKSVATKNFLQRFFYFLERSVGDYSSLTIDRKTTIASTAEVRDSYSNSAAFFGGGNNQLLFFTSILHLFSESASFCTVGQKAHRLDVLYSKPHIRGLLYKNKFSNGFFCSVKLTAPFVFKKSKEARRFSRKFSRRYVLRRTKVASLVKHNFWYLYSQVNQLLGLLVSTNAQYFFNRSIFTRRLCKNKKVQYASSKKRNSGKLFLFFKRGFFFSSKASKLSKLFSVLRGCSTNLKVSS